jgi:hypothetical protein
MIAQPWDPDITIEFDDHLVTVCPIPRIDGFLVYRWEMIDLVTGDVTLGEKGPFSTIDGAMQDARAAIAIKSFSTVFKDRVLKDYIVKERYGMGILNVPVV